MRLLSEKLAAETHNKMGWQHNLLDVAVAYVSEIKKIKDHKVAGLFIPWVYTSNGEAKAGAPLWSHWP